MSVPLYTMQNVSFQLGTRIRLCSYSFRTDEADSVAAAVLFSLLQISINFQHFRHFIVLFKYMSDIDRFCSN